jgi:hypothetical protein
MRKLTKDDLYSLEDYAQVRSQFRSNVMAHKRDRRLPLGMNTTLYFEDTLTMHYQIQEILRIERIFEESAINEELDVYNPLIPDGSNWKATFMVEFPESVERRAMLTQLIGIENSIWMQVDDSERIRPVADEDLDRSDKHKTSAVHFLRFELNSSQIQAFKSGARLSAGIDHENYQVEISPVMENIRNSLLGDLD